MTSQKWGWMVLSNCPKSLMLRPEDMYFGPSWVIIEGVRETKFSFKIFIEHTKHFIIHAHTHALYIRGSLNKFPDFFSIWALLLIVHTWNSSPLRSNLLRLQCTCCTVTTTSGRPHRSPLVWACQWPSSQPLSSSQLSHNGSLWA